MTALYRIIAGALILLLFDSCSVSSQTGTGKNQPAVRTYVHAARTLDVRTGKIVRDPLITIDGERITQVSAGRPPAGGANVIELGDTTLLPGLIDAHTHITYHFDENGTFGVTNYETAADALK